MMPPDLISADETIESIIQELDALKVNASRLQSILDGLQELTHDVKSATDEVELNTRVVRDALKETKALTEANAKAYDSVERWMRSQLMDFLLKSNSDVDRLTNRVVDDMQPIVKATHTTTIGTAAILSETVQPTLTKIDDASARLDNSITRTALPTLASLEKSAQTLRRLTTIHLLLFVATLTALAWLGRSYLFSMMP